MDTGFYLAGSAADLRRQLSMDQIANNLANINTVGFKADQNAFSTKLTDQMRSSGNHQQPTAYLAAGKHFVDTSEGVIRQTENPLDFALQGDGYFRVQQQDGSEAYTRAGNFTLDGDSTLITQSGLPVLDINGAPITIPSGNLSASHDGVLSVNGNKVATLGVVQINDPRLMSKRAGTLFVTDLNNVTRERPANTIIAHGAVEQSNVNAVLSMAKMVDVTRSFQNMMKIVEIYNQQASQLTEKVARVG
ncbi:MAG: flagellar hook basal-body protein [Mariprofundales bacterium]|nr:flagellar hook basal-body protein [Mariprofundales bacterium]